MQVNRLNHLVFPPNASPAASLGAEALQPEAGKSKPSPVAVVQRAEPPVLDTPLVKPEAAPAPASVKLELDSASKTPNIGTYTKEGVVPGKPGATGQTPAEHFVASAVNILREFDQSASLSGSEGTPASGQTGAAAASRFGSFKQAVSRLNVFA